MNPEAFRALLAGLIVGFGTALGLRCVKPAKGRRVRSAWPDLAGNFAL